MYKDIFAGISGGIFVLGVIILAMWGCPQYRVYSQRKDGEAQLAHAKYSREVAVAEAKAKMEASSLLAQADTIRAHGTARTNEIIGNSITEKYLQWMWVNNLEKENDKSYIYVPSGNLGLPLMNFPVQEATRLNSKR